MPFDDVTALKRLRELYAERLAAPGYVDYGDYGNEGAPDQVFNTPPSVINEPPAQVYAGGGLVERAAKALKDPSFRKWFDGSVVHDAGVPRVVYRGEHGDVPESGLHSRLNSLSFGDADAANTYALSPNDLRDNPVAPRIYPSLLSLKKPFINNPDDPFLDVSEIARALGKDDAMTAALRFEDAATNTNNWNEEINRNRDYLGVADYLKANPKGLDNLFIDAYGFLDDPEFVNKLRAKGYDGAIHGGSGETALTPEYRAFSPDRARSAITLQPYAEGGAVDTLGGPDYEDYGSGRFTRTPAERRVVREERQAQWQPPSPEDDWGTREWDRFGSKHNFNPLSYGMEALGRLDSAGRDSNSAADIKSLLGADHYQRSGLLSDAFVDVGNLLTLGLPGLGRKAVANVAPLVYDAAQELAPEMLGRSEKPEGYREGGVVDIIKSVRDKFGKTQGRRIEQAADLTNLERLNEKAIYDLFDPANRSSGAGLLAAMPPEDFQNYAKPIPDFARQAVPYPRWHNVPRSQARGIAKEDRGLDTYLDLLGNRIMDKGLDNPATMWMSRTLDPLTRIDEHEGRHRMMALGRLGEDKSLVNLRPGNTGELRGDIDERLERLQSKYFPRGGKELIVPEADDLLDVKRLPRPLYAEPFAGGGQVLSRIEKLLVGKPKAARLPSGEMLDAHPIKEFSDVADSFARRQGNAPLESYPAFDEDRARRIAEAYEAMKHDPLDPQVRRSYDALIGETMDQYKALEGTGAKFEFLRPGEADPYAASPALGYKDLIENGRLKIFPTDSGFGTLNDIQDNPLLRRVGRVGDLEDATANDAFRVVHDALGHFGPGNPFFRHQGEERAWRDHARTFSPDALPAMTSETRGQNSWVNFGPHGERNRAASGADTTYADQKTGLLPEWAYEKAYKDGGLVKFVKNMREFLGPEKAQALDKIGKVTDATKNEALIYGTPGVDDPLSAITRGDRTGVAIPPWADRFAETARRNELPWFSAHTHPNNTLSPSLGDLTEWARHAEYPQDMLIGAWPQRSSLQLGAAPAVDQWDRLAPRDIVAQKRAAEQRPRDKAFSDLQGLVDFSSAHGLQLPRGQALSPVLHELEAAPILDYMARRGVPVAMDASHTIPQTGGALAADVYPELMNFYRGKGKYHAPFDLGYKDGGLVGLAKKAWKTRRAEDLEKEVRDLNRGKSKPSDPFTSPDVDKRLQTVDDPSRIMFPGIYKDPRDIVGEAKSRLLPDRGEDSPMFRLFGHTRQSLDELSQGERRFDDFRPGIGFEHPFTPSARGTGAAVSEQVLQPRNAGRILDTLGEALKDPELRRTRSWYEMTPFWDKATELGVGDSGPYSKRALNTRLGVMSPASDPTTEIERGMLANYLAHEGRTADFVRYGGVPDEQRGDWFPKDMLGMKSHAYHGTAHVPNLLDFETTGKLWSPKHKVPTYVAATDPIHPYGERPVADAHFTRFLGYPDVRTSNTMGTLRKELSGSEYGDMFPWWNDKIAGKLDERPRDAQALMWNVGGPQTGVRYIGPSKLEMMSDFMEQSAHRLGVSPETARDRIMTGQSPGFAHGGAVEDDMALWGSQNYAGGGSVDDEALGYDSMYYGQGGPVPETRGFFR